MKFPEAPQEMQQPASDLKPLPEDKKNLADLLENVNENYGTYYQLKEKYEAWIEWYKAQKQIFESVK
jgi:hypothetical protein